MKRILFLLSSIIVALCSPAQSPSNMNHASSYGEAAASNVFTKKILEKTSTDYRWGSAEISSFSYNDSFQLTDVVSIERKINSDTDKPYYTMSLTYESGVVDEFEYDMSIHVDYFLTYDNRTEDYYIKINEHGFCAECYEIWYTPNAQYPDEKITKYKSDYLYNDNNQIVYRTKYHYKYGVTSITEITYDGSGRLTHIKDTNPYILGGGAVVSDYDVNYVSDDIAVPIPNTYNIPVGFDEVIYLGPLDCHIAGLLGMPSSCLPLEITGVKDPSHGLTFNRAFDWALDDNNTPLSVKIYTEQDYNTGHSEGEDTMTFEWREVSHILDVDININEADQWYSINGYPIPAPQKGLNIVRRANGKVEKVIVR